MPEEENRALSAHRQSPEEAEGHSVRMPLTDEQIEQVSQRWGEIPRSSQNWCTIPYITRKQAELVGADVANRPVGYGYWAHMLDLYSDPERPIGLALSLACGHGHQERTLISLRKVLHCDAYDISEPALENARAIARAQKLDHVITYERRDLNHLRLSSKYDAVIAGGIHHVSNLEHLFSEVSRSLTPGGFFLLYEYIGPSQCQRTMRQVEAINACIRLIPPKYRVRASAQAELGVRTPEEALSVMRHSRRVLAQLQETGRDIDLARFSVAPGASMNRGPALTVVTPPGAWFYAATLALHTRDFEPLAPNKPVHLLVKAKVAAGRVGIGCTGANMATYFTEASLSVSNGDRWIDLRIAPHALPAYLILRNVAEDQTRSEVVIERVVISNAGSETSTRSGDPDDDTPLESDPNFSRYFLNSYVPMTREQWTAVDPSESVRSDEIIPLLRKNFDFVDVRYTGGSILENTLYDIEANFHKDTVETRALLDMLLRIEEALLRYDDVPQNYAVIVAKNS
jgi:SAM-dependent methyltransferase